MIEFKELQNSVNIADLLEDEELNEIGEQVVKGLELDEASRQDWKDRVDGAQKIAKQLMAQKNYPFEGASNIKYPLITQAAIDFASRTYPEIIQNDRVVRPKVIGMDPDGSKLQRAQNVAKLISYQLLHQMEDWEQGMDKMLHIFPIIGTVFKKTYYDERTKAPCSELCLPEKIVVNYNTQSLCSCRRVSHLLDVYKNDIIENIRRGIYRDISKELGPKDEDDANGIYNDDAFENSHNPEGDPDAPIQLIEQHTFLDLDEDGYAEPYIITVHRDSKKVMRIVSRFANTERNKKGQIVRIEPEQYFTDYHYLPATDGGFYSNGIGTILLPLNEAINTLVNQLIDSGTLNNMQGGLIGRGLRLRNGEIRVQMGRYQSVDAAPGQTLAQNIFPWPTKEPSMALFQLLGLLIQQAKDLMATTDVLEGKAQVQNVSPTAMMSQIQQGMKVFNAITKRVYQGMYREIQKIYKINQQYLTNKEYQAVVNDPRADVKADFNPNDHTIIPVANPMMASDTQRLAKAQAIIAIPPTVTYGMKRYYLEALQLDDAEIERVAPPPDPNAPPPPEVMKTLAETEKIKADAQKSLVDAQTASNQQMIEVHKTQLMGEDVKTRAQEAAARIFKMKADAHSNDIQNFINAHKVDMESKLGEFSAIVDKRAKEAQAYIAAYAAKQKEKKDEPVRSGQDNGE